MSKFDFSKLREQVKGTGLALKETFKETDVKLEGRSKQAQHIAGRTRPTQSQKMSGELNPMAGKVHPNKGKTMPKTSAKLKGIKRSEETKKQISETRKAKGLTNTWKGKTRPDHSAKMKEYNPGFEKTQVAWTCPHCGKEGVGLSNYSRWHGDNCKHK